MLRWSAVALVCVALACKNGIPQPPAAVPDTCSSDVECSSGFRCDSSLRRCVCKSDDSCGTGHFCNAFTGLCVDSVPGCTSDAVCGAGNYCDIAVRTCKPTTGFCQPCKTDAQCGAGSKCAAHPLYKDKGTFCEPACAAGCAQGLACMASPAGDQLCYPSTGACGQSNACVPDSLKLCASDADCGDSTQTCDATLKECVARVKTCQSGFSCDPQSRVCANACASDAECAQIEGKAGYQCRNNACYALALCSSDNDCSTGQICSPNPDGSKSCHAGCVSSADCPLGQGCDTNSSHPHCAAGCTQNSDCPLNAICSNGTCSSTFQGCTQACQDTAACAIGSTCFGNCCTQLNWGNECGASGCPACTASGCQVSCNVSCFPMNLGSCNALSDCQAKGLPVPPVVCNTALHQCQTEGALKPCTSNADCPYKGFRCTALSSFGCSGGSVCFPYEASAQLACGVGHN